VCVEWLKRALEAYSRRFYEFWRASEGLVREVGMKRLLAEELVPLGWVLEFAKGPLW
jgi:hypothetical protein